MSLTPELSLFKKNYTSISKFYKQYNNLKDVKLNWDDMKSFDIKNHTYLSHMYIKVKIPYFNLVKNINNVTTSEVKNSILNNIIYDNFETYLFNNSSGDYYLIPEFLMNNKIDYSFKIIKFKDIAIYFNQITQYKINLESDIYFAYLNSNVYNNDVFILLLTFGVNIDRYYLNLLNTIPNDMLYNVLLTPNTFDTYLETVVKQYLFDDYQNMNKIDSNYTYYEMIADEIKYFYKNYDFISNYELNDNQSILDVYKSYQYFMKNKESFDSNIITYLTNTIKNNSLLIKYLIKNICPDKNITYTFYKKYNNIPVNTIYELYIEDSDLLDVNSTGATNLIETYYPNLYLDIDVVNAKIPFTLSSSMTFKTVGNLSATYTNAGETNLIKVNDTSNYYGNKILFYVSLQQTNNEVYDDVNINDYNLNNEWNDNLARYLEDDLNYDTNNELFIFNEYKKNFYLKELLINNLYNNLKLTADNIKDLWIELKVYYDRFFEENVEINYIDGDGTDFNVDKAEIFDNYAEIQDIEQYPQDLFNTYLLCIREFVDSIKNNYFLDNTFINIWHNKLVLLFYKRFFKVSQLDDLVKESFNGLIFYSNFNSLYYISKEIIKNSIDELFNKKHFIGYISNKNNTDLPTPYTIKNSNLNNFFDNPEETDNNYSDCFVDYETITKYNIYKDDFFIDGYNIVINKNILNYYYFHDNLCKFSIDYNNNIYNVSSYKIDDKYIYLLLGEELLTKYDFILIEDSHYTIPYINMDRSDSAYDSYRYLEIGNDNNFNRYTIYKKAENVDLIINNSNIYFNDIDINDSPFLQVNKLKYHIYIVLKNNDNYVTQKVYLIDNDYYKKVMVDENTEYFIDYERYDEIYLDVIELPLTTVNIEDIDIYSGKLLVNTYPYVYLDKSSTKYTDNAALFSDNQSSLFTLDGLPIRIEDETNDYLQLLVIDNVPREPTNIELYIYDNNYVCNLRYFSSLYYNNNIIGDYYLQKPLIKRVAMTKDGEDGKDDDDIPAYFFINIPDNSNLTRYISNETYINSSPVNIVHNMESAQFIRFDNNDPLDGTGTEKKYNLAYDKYNLLDTNFINEIEDEILSHYDESFNNYKGSVITMLEESYKEYYDMYVSTLNILETTNDFGSSSQNVFNIIKELNKFTSENSVNEYYLSINNYKCIEYDCYTPFTISIFNLTNNNGQSIYNDFNLLAMMSKKYNNVTKNKITVMPYLEYESRLKISNDVYTYLDNHNQMSKQQLDYNEKNKLVDTIVNTNISTEGYNIVNFTQNKYVDKYIKYSNNVNQSKITIINNNEFVDYVNNDNSDDIYVTSDNINNKSINISYNDGNIYTDNEIEMYNDNTIYNEERVENDDNVYKLIGAVKVVDNQIIFNDTLPVNSNNEINIDYLNINGHIIDYNNYSVANNYIGFYYSDCYAYKINNDSELVTINDINNDMDKMYVYKLTSDDIGRFLSVGNYYLVINEKYCYGYYDGTYLFVLSISQIYFRNTIIVSYVSTLDDNDTIYTNITSNTDNIIVNNYFVIEQFILYENNIFNKYYVGTLNYINNGIFFKDITKTEMIDNNNYFNILGRYFFNLDMSITDIVIYSTTSTLLPPLYVKNDDIYIYNTLEEIDWKKNTNHWICIGNTEIQIKNLDSLSIANGTYLLYYGDSDIKPVKMINTDIYYEKVYYDNTLDTSLPENKYKNLLERDHTTSSLNYIWRQPYRSQFGTACNTLQLYKLTDYVIYILNKCVTYDDPVGKYMYYNIERYLNIGDFEYGTELKNHKIYQERKSYIDTEIILTDGANKYKRPLVITSDPADLSYKILYYKLYNTSSTEIDSLYVFPTTFTTGDFMKITFDTLYYLGQEELPSDDINFKRQTSQNTIVINSVKSNNTLVNVSQNSSTTFTFNINGDINDLTEERFYKIVFTINFTNRGVNDTENVTQENEIIIWLIRSDTYPTFGLYYQPINLNIIDSYEDGRYLREPAHFRSNSDSHREIIINTPGYTFDYVNEQYFIYEPTIIKTITPISGTLNRTDNFYMYGNKLKSYDEVKDNPNVDEIGVYNNSGEYLPHKKNNWEYIDNFTINNVGDDSIIISTILVKYVKNNNLPIILVNNDKFYYRNIKQYNDTQIFLDNNVDFTNADVYIYPFTQFFINENVSVNIDVDKAYVYMVNKMLARNEVIIIGDYTLFVDYFSVYYDCYICTIISKSSSIITNKGYYSLGKFNNYFERSRLLINNELTTNYLKTGNSVEELTTGDLYIYDNNINFFDGVYSEFTNKFFRFDDGIYLDLLYINGDFYYDTHKINFHKDMYLVYMLGGLVYRFNIDYVDNNKLVFYTTYGLTFYTGDKIRVYLPHQPFKKYDIEISNGVINEVTNGFMIKEGNLYTIKNNNIIPEISNNGEIYILDLDSIDYSYDFNNPYVLKDYYTFDVINNLCIQLDVTVNKDEQYIYLTNDINFDFRNINYYYYQYVLLNDCFHRLTDITENRIYLDTTVSEFNLNIDNGVLKLSAYNVNNDFICCNRYQLNNCSHFDYPNVDGDNNLSIIYNSNNNFTSKINIGVDVNCERIQMDNRQLMLINSPKYNLYKNEVNLNNFNKQFYIENFIRYNEKTNDELDILESESLAYPTKLEKETLNINSGNNIYIEERLNNNRYIHMVDIEIVNNCLKIKDYDKFTNLEDSYFYLHRLIPIRITKNNYIQLLNPEFIKIKQINNKNRNDLILKVYFRVSILSKPVKINNKWRYSIVYNFGEPDIDKYIYNEDIYIDNSDDIMYIEDSYLYSNNLIDTSVTHLYFKHKKYVDKITHTNISTKDEYSELDDSSLNWLLYNNYYNRYKILNRGYIFSENNNYYFKFPDNTDTNIDFGNLEGSYYINNNNKLTFLNITDSTYNIIPEYKLLNISNVNNEVLYYEYISDSEKLFHKKRELSTSYSYGLNLLIKKGIDINMILYYLKPWNEWTQVSLNNTTEYLTNAEIKYDGTTFENVSSTNSVFTSNEVDIIKTFLENIYDDYSYNIALLTDYYSLQQHIYDNIEKHLFDFYFWDNIDNVIKNIVESYDSNYSYKYVNGKIYNYRNNVNNEIFYLSQEYTITVSPDDILYVYRGRTTVKTQLDLFINGTLSASNMNLYGINIISVIDYIKTLKNQLDSYSNDDIMKLLFNHKYPNMLKLIINKIYYKLLDDDNNGLDNLNHEFYKLEYNFDNTVGGFNNNLFEENYTDILSKKKINITQSAIDTYYIYEKYNFGDLNLYHNYNYKNTINSDAFNLYKMTINSDIILKSDSEYVVDIYNDNDIVDFYEKYIYNDTIQFYSNKTLKDNDIGLNVTDKYQIKNITYNGKLFAVYVTEYNYIQKTTKIYYNEKLVKYYIDNKIHSTKLTNELNKNGIDIYTHNKYRELLDFYNNYPNFIKLAINIDELDEHFIKTVDQVIVKNITNNNNIHILTLNDNIDNIFISNNTYIDVNNELYLLKNDGNNYYIESDNINIIKNRIYNIIKFMNIVDSLFYNEYIATVELNENFNNNIYNYNEPNITHSELNILHSQIKNINCIDVIYDNDISITDYNLKHTYKIQESDYIDIKTITKSNKYLYTINKNIENKDNVELYFNYIDKIDIYDISNNITIYLDTYENPTTLNLNDIYIKYKYDLLLIEQTSLTSLITTIPSNLSYINYIDYIYTIVINDLYEYTTEIEIKNNRLYINLDGDIIDEIESIYMYENLIYESGEYEINNVEYNTFYEIELNSNYVRKNKTDVYPYIKLVDDTYNEIITKYTYKFEINDITNITFGDYIYLDNNKVSILMIQYDDKYIVNVGSDIYLDTTINYTFYNYNYSYSTTVTIDNGNDVYNELKYVSQTDNTITVLSKLNKLDTYNINYNETVNKMIYYEKYSNIELINDTYKNIGFNKVPSTIITTTNNYIDSKEVEWDSYNIFSKIKFVHNNKSICKIDKDTIKINTTFYEDKYKRDIFNKLTDIKLIDNYYQFILPLHVFNNIYDSYPLYDKDIKIELHTDKIDNMIKNKGDYNYSSNVYPIVDINYDYITTLNKDTNNVNRYLYPYNTYILNKEYENNKLELKSRVSNIFFAIDNIITYTYNYDDRYKTYIDNYNKYLLGENTDDYYIFALIDGEIDNNSDRYSLLNNHYYLKNFDTKYVMYLDIKYLNHINEDLNNLSSHSQKLTLLTLYFNKIYKNVQIEYKTSPIDSLYLEINGKNLTPRLEHNYYKLVRVMDNGYDLDDDYSLYTFCMETVDTHNKYINDVNGVVDFNKITNFNIITKQNTFNNNIKMKIIVEEYK
jgi:hypothetical protein